MPALPTYILGFFPRPEMMMAVSGGALTYPKAMNKMMTITKAAMPMTGSVRRLRKISVILPP